MKIVKKRFGFIGLWFVFFFLLSCENAKQEVEIYHDPNVTVEIFTNNFTLKTDTNLIDSDLLNLTYNFRDKDLSFDIFLGYTIGSLTEVDPIIIREKEVYLDHLASNRSGQDIHYLPIGESLDIDLYRERNVRFDSINGKLCKIIRPRRGSKGMYAVHYYSLFDHGIRGDLQLSIIGYDLSELEENELIRLAKSVKCGR